MRSLIGIVPAIASTVFGFHASPLHAEPDNIAVAEWVEGQAMALTTTEPGASNDDLTKLSEVIGEARIVSFGEPTHGNREIFQLKHRVFQYLVEEKGFSVLAMEAPFAETERLNTYVQGGEGSASEALAGLTMWAWDTQELADLLDWIRGYNRQPGNETKIKIHGFDIQAPERAASLMFEYFDLVDPDMAREIAPELGSLAISFSDPDEWGWRPVITAESDAASLAMARRAISMLERNRDRYVDQTSLGQWEQAHHLSKQVAWWIEANARDQATSYTVRDRSMAFNLDWIMERAGPTAKAFVWAHNSHVADAQIQRWGNVDTFGRHARRIFGDDLKIIGSFFGEGEITAVSREKIATFSVNSPRPNSLEATLSASGLEIALLDLSLLPSEGTVRDYFHEPRETMHSGGGYSNEDISRYFMNYRLAEAFDILAFVQRTTASRTIEPADYGTMPIRAEPANLNFELGNRGQAPLNWFVWSKIRRWGYNAITVPRDDAEGGQAGSLCGDSLTVNSDTSGSLLQRIDASPYRGRQMALSGIHRVSGLGTESRAFARVKVISDASIDAHAAQDVLNDTLDAYRITSEDWSTFEIPVDIPENANSIIFGIYLSGQGCAYVDDLEVSSHSNPAS